MNGFGDKVSFIWSVADLLRGPDRRAQYGRVILPLTVPRRLDRVLEPTKAAVLARHAAKQAFHTPQQARLPQAHRRPRQHRPPNPQHYIAGFSSRAREIIEYFGFEADIRDLETEIVRRLGEITGSGAEKER